MSNYCIVSEFDPFHNGHEYLIKRAKERGASAVICVMSGNSTQRGELAMVDKYLRARAAIISGADLVLELPYPWCSSSADFFSTAAVSIAEAFGDVLLFGSESGDIAMLNNAAQLCESDEFNKEYAALTLSGMGSAAAYVECLKKRGISDISSNDILGIAYIRAIKRMKARILPECEARIGAAYSCENVTEGIYQSATAIRSLFAKGRVSLIERYVPAAMRDILAEESAKGTVTDVSEIHGLIHGFFRLSAPSCFEGIAETAGGLSNRICELSRTCVTYEEMFSRLRTKAYTDARIRRTMLFCMTGVEQKHLLTQPQYTLLLGASSKGRELLSKNRKQKVFEVVTKPADAPSNTVQYTLSQKLDALYGLARKNKLSADEFYKRSAFICNN